MKKNITINLCGRLFQIDEDAYELLQQYIESLRQSFGRKEDGDEIVNDIEARIAELFDELRQQDVEAITIDHVKDIITRIGKPEQLTGDDEGKEEEHKTSSEGSNTQSIFDNMRARTAGKRLYRNPNDQMVAGVLSGLASYTHRLCTADIRFQHLPGTIVQVLFPRKFLFNQSGSDHSLFRAGHCHANRQYT